MPKTGKSIPGVKFFCEMDGRRGARVMVQKRTGYVDFPETDANGRLRAVVEPGAGSSQ